MRLVPPEFSLLHPFAAPMHGPWRWVEKGRVVVWEDGSTVVFEEELDGIIESFGPRKAPQFPVLIFILAACRGKYADKQPSVLGARGQVLKRLQEAGEGLRKLGSLPHSLRTNMEARAEIVQMITEHLPRGLIQDEVLRNWHWWRNGGRTDERHTGLDYTALILWQMMPGLKEFTEEKLRARLGTGLEDVPEPAPLPDKEDEEKGPAPLRELLKDLEEDAELSGLAEVVRSVLAALVIPRRLSCQDDLPAGGVSDVVNRGSPERLLITELAYDPDITAARMVMGEALYLRREPPAVRRDPPPLVLVDFSLRLWGLPRVFAAATALAILALRGDKSPSHAWRIEKGMPRCRPLRRKSEVAAFLSHMEPVLDPLPGLQAWIQSLEKEPPESERCFITHAAQLKHGGFRNALRSLPGMLLATVDRDGSFALHRHEPSQGLRLLCEAMLPLESLFKEAPKTAQKLKGGTGYLRQPLFFKQEERPLLLSPGSPPSWAMPMQNGGGIAVSDSGHVVCWTSVRLGCRLLYCAPEARGALFFHRIEEGRYALFLRGERGRSNTVRVVILRTEGIAVERLLTLSPVDSTDAITADGSVAFFAGKTSLKAFSLETGDLLGTNPTGVDPEGVLPHGFLHIRKRQPMRLGWNGTAITLHEVLHGEFVTTWYWMELTQSLVSYIHGKGMHVNGQPVTPPKDDLTYARFFAQFLEKLNAGAKFIPGPLGSRVMLEHGTTRHLYELIPSVWPEGQPLLRWITSQIGVGPGMFRRTGGLAIPSVSHTIHLKSAAFSADGRLGVKTTKSGVWRWLVLQPQPVWRPGEAPPEDDPAIRHFSPEKMEGSDRAFSVVAWWLRLSIWLDTDGLLHLVCTDPSVPEITLTLSDPSLAWWMSDGTTGGRTFFLKPGVTATPYAVGRLKDAISRMAAISHQQ